MSLWKNAVCVAVAALLAPCSSGAQEVPDEIPAGRMGEPLAPRPELVPLAPSEPRPEVMVPAVPGAAEPESAAVLSVFIRDFRFTGNTAVPTSRLDEIAAAFEGRAITDLELQELRARLTRAYADAGYVTSRAVIPDQDIAAGVVTIEIIEGRLAGVELEGEHHFHPEFLRRRIASGASVPLNINALQSHLRWLLLDPLLAGLDARLEKGHRPDETILHTRVREGDRFGIGLSAANDRSPAVGGERAVLEGITRNLTGRGDTFGLTVSGGSALRDSLAYISMPLNPHGTEFYLSHAEYEADLIEEPFDALNVEIQFRTLEFALRHPVYRTPQRDVDIGLTFARRRSESFLDGAPFSFSPGAKNGRTDVSVARTSMQWLERGTNGVLGARLTVSTGLDMLGATSHDDGRPDSEFLALLAQLQWLWRLGPAGGQLYARFDMQQSSDALLPLEKYVLGGTYSVRGFRRARLVRDNGWAGALEYRLPIARLAVPWISGDSGDGRLSLVAFFDVGRAWNDQNPEGDLNHLYGAGPGMRWEAGRGMRAELYWGAFRRDVGSVGDDLQDEGIHFLVSVRRSF